MKEINFKNSAKSLNFGYFYFTCKYFEGLEKYTSYFKNFYQIDLSKQAEDIPSIDILFIEVDSVTKEKLILLNSILKQYVSKCTYIFSEDPSNSFLLKLALHFSLNKVLPLADIHASLENYFNEAIKKHFLHQAEKQQIEISKRLNAFFAILAFKDDSLIFVNEKAKEIFGSHDITHIESMIKENEAIFSLLDSQKNENRLVIMKNPLGEDWQYNFFLNATPNGKDKLLSVIPYRKAQEDRVNFSTLNRFKFIELLKDRLAQNHLNDCKMSLMLINVSNYEKITKASGSIKVHDFIKKFIAKIITYTKNHQDLTQWNPHFFIILVEDESFKQVKQNLDLIHQKLIYSDFDETIHPVITSSVLEIATDDINTIISHVESISDRNFKINDFGDNEFFEINHLNDYLSEEEQISHYLHSCIANKSVLKLLNIYKGLCINTQSKVIKADGDSYFFSFETLQGYSMQIEKKTVIQSADLPNDISADVIYVNFEKSFVMLTNFAFMNTSANNRQSTRVQPSIRTPLLIRYEKFSYQGEIIDLSINAIAANFFQKISDQLLNQHVCIVFKLLDDSNDDGYVEIKVKAKATYISAFDKVTKVVFILDALEKPYDSYMLKYMYSRQKELIIELKRAVKTIR
jgi:hypothetical protein